MMMAAVPKARTDDGLDRQVAAAAACSVEFPHVLANHLPMVLVALHRLGASEARMRQFAERYRAASGLVPVPASVAPIGAADWRDHLGDRTREADYRAFFHREVRRLGGRRAVEAYLPELVPGIAASALHALMRLAYATLRDDADETAIGLAYLCGSYLPLRTAGGHAPDTDDPAAVLLAMRPEPAFAHVESETDLLWHWMRATARLPAFEGLVDRLRIGHDTLARVAAVSIRLMAATMTFEALHAVTGAHWVRLLRGLGCDAMLLRYFWQAIAAVYPKIGMPLLPDEPAFAAMRRAPCPDWPEIAAAACASDDEHDVSFAFSAREEQAVYGDRLYQVTAARRVGLIP
ncbi:MAG: questin oxidase family protein [Alphaproteobacteria bacterium]